ncbi:MAG TPA: hypothetical protein VN622_10940 [Clostridia bacterium]|nr:hypothetical protein [Clostridia bacterium]
MAAKTRIKINLDPNFLRKVQNAAKAAVRDCFEDEILPAAREGSPRDTGENADSIGIRVRSYPGRVHARIFTESGHGGYIEKGTRKMGPRPYILPAVERGLANLGDLVRARLEKFANKYEDVPDELISNAINKLKTKRDKGVGIVGAKEAKQKSELKRFRKNQRKRGLL